MRKAIFQAATGLLCAILTVGCTSDQLDQREDPSQEIQVTFNVSPLSVSTGEIPGTGTGARAKVATRAAVTGEDLGDLVKEVGYLIFKDDMLYKRGSVSFDPETQEAPENFGTLQEKLLPASYYVVFYAYGKDGSTAKKSENGELGQFYFYENGTDDNTELYLYQGELTVSNNTTEIDVTLVRKSGLLSVQISDDPISEVAYVTYAISSYYRYYPNPRMEWYKTEYAWTYTKKSTVTGGKLPDTNIWMISPKNPTTLTISIYDNENQLLGSQEITVSLYTNRRTIVSGNLFSNLGDKPLTITINDSWGEDVNVNLK